MPDFLADDFGAIARAMRRDAAAPPRVLLHFWHLLTRLTSEHDNVEAAIAEAHELWTHLVSDPEHLALADGTILMDRDALTEAMTRYAQGLPI
ncbi:hypothetical protein [Paracraurococcus ruber]|uniref:Uncharacterized protein n=1 Tax=Paracraurococcus ruber TaxID=77675 RepID=A0ABS1CTW6_9PROT|nr:hypothetical protein [Paracraurococcus ruber]MBK1657793.1 hypothetical protein [Paracraurococcus ruber]TDG26851.1 hypothetical protein E2C05_24820 [Paracraurococcus ruber]